VLPRAGLLLAVSGDFFLVASYCPTHHSRVLKKKIFSVLSTAAALTPLPSSWFLLQLLQALSQCCDVRCSLTAPTVFNGANYRDWVPHMRGLRLWDFLTGELPCPPSPSAPAQPVISEKTTAAEKEHLLVDYEDRLASYESQFHVYMTWLDEDARAGSVLAASMDDRFAADIMDFERIHQMWSFLHQKYESTGQSTYLAAIRQEQLLRQGDSTVDNFFDQFFCCLAPA
jgi:hypothetical protein